MNSKSTPIAVRRVPPLVARLVKEGEYGETFWIECEKRYSNYKQASITYIYTAARR